MNVMSVRLLTIDTAVVWSVWPCPLDLSTYIMTYTSNATQQQDGARPDSQLQSCRTSRWKHFTHTFVIFPYFLFSRVSLFFESFCCLPFLPKAPHRMRMSESMIPSGGINVSVAGSMRLGYLDISFVRIYNTTVPVYKGVYSCKRFF